MTTLKPNVKHFLQFKDFSRGEYDYLFERTRWIKEQFKSYKRYWPLSDRTLVMIFEKASTRTRLSFEAGVQQLGGAAIYLNTRDSQLGRGEPVEDAAQVISRMSDLIMIRTFEQDIVERLAAHSRVPVINGLTNEYHPCQIMADIYTYIEQRGPIQGKTVAWIGDSNNMCNTWLQAAEVLGFLRYRVDAAWLRGGKRARRSAWYGALQAVCESHGRRERRGYRDHRCVDFDGFRGGKRGTSARFCRLAGRRRDDARCAAGCHFPALFAGTPR